MLRHYSPWFPSRIIRYSFPNKSSWQIKNTELDSTSFAERRVSVFALVSVLENRDPSFPLRWRGLPFPDFPRSSGPEQRDMRVTPVSRRFVGAAAARLCCFINKIHRDPRTGWATTPRGPVWQPERKRKRELVEEASDARMEGGVERWREGNNNGDNSDSIKHNVWTRRREGGSEEGVLSMGAKGGGGGRARTSNDTTRGCHWYQHKSQ